MGENIYEYGSSGKTIARQPMIYFDIGWLLIFIPLIFLLISLWWFWSSKNSRHRSSETTLEGIHDLLDPPTPLSDILRSRAIPNARLIRAFNIRTSTFITDDTTVHRHFVNKAKSLLNPYTTTVKWMRMRDSAENVVDTYIASHGQHIEFDTLMQVITFVVVLVTLLDADPASMEFDDVVFVTRGINDLWCLSKTTADMPKNLLSDIEVHLQRWLPRLESPLELILPAYETLWRVVAATVAQTHDDPATTRVFSEFLENPTREQFECYADDRPSPEAVIIETLRLYPPTSHIHRSVPAVNRAFWAFRAILFHLPSSLCDIITRMLFTDKRANAFADVKAVQRSAVWGSSPEMFNAMRHSPARVTEEQQATMMAFGYGKVKCVAQAWAPRSAAVIAGAILHRVGIVGGDHEVVAGGVLGGRDGWNGWIVRTREHDLTR